MLTKKWNFLVLVLLLALAVTACAPEASTAPNSSSTGNEQTGDNVTVRYVIPGSIPGTEAGVESAHEAINEKLLADGTGIQYELTTIPWDAWDQRTTLMLTTDESFDLLHVMEDQKGFVDLYGRDAIVDLTDYVAEYGSNITRMIPESVMDAAKIDDRLYTIPAYWLDPAKGTQAITIRTDWLEESGMGTPETSEELMSSMTWMQDNWTGEGSPGIVLLYTEPARFLYRTFDSYPFTVIEQLIYVSQEGEVLPWYETEEFKKEAEFFNECYQKGFISPDILTLPSGWRETEVDQGRFLMRDGTGLPSLKTEEEGNFKTGLIFLAPDKPDFTDMVFRNDNVVPVTSEHPEAAVKLLDWLYESQENYDLFINGVEGEHWNNLGEGVYEQILDENEQTLYGFSTWMIGNLNYAYVTSTTHPDYAATHFAPNPDAIQSVTVGFQFDSSSVSAEYSACLAEVKSSLYPIKVGIVEYNDGIEAMRSNFKAAGIDKLIDEYQRQFDEWQDGK